MSEHDTPFIRVSGLSRAFEEAGKRHVVLSDLAFSLARGERVALLGRSGSGKSTLLNLISGIDRADKGSILIDGLELNGLDEQERTVFRRRHIGFIYQFFNLVPSLTARENIAFILELNGWPETEINPRVDALMQRLDILDKAEAFPSRLSGGEQQRVAIARALVHAPKLVLADEPSGNLDAETGRRMLDVLQALLGENRAATLLVTHSLEVARTADRILTLEDGVLVEREATLAW